MSLPLPDTNDRRNGTSGAIYVPAGAGFKTWFSGDIYSVKLTAADAHGSIGIVQASVFLNVGFHPAQMIFLYTPGGSEGLFVEGGDEPRPGVQIEAWGPERFENELMQSLYVKYGVETHPDQK
jgi:hypothetical protein